jgi:hypothetical protein
MKDWINFLENVVLSGVALISAFVSVADFVGILNKTSWLVQRINTLTLLSISLVAAYLVIERRRHLERLSLDNRNGFENLTKIIEKSTSTAIESLKGVEFKTFANNTELMTYVVKQLKNAKESVDDLTWSHRLSLRQYLPVHKKVEDAYQDCIGEISKRIEYREIFIFNKMSRIQKLKRRLDENTEGYSYAYYKSSEVPPIQYIIIDKQEVIFASAVFPIKCAIKHPKIAELLEAYFEEAWRYATPLKLGKQLFTDEINKVLSKADFMDNQSDNRNNSGLDT